MRLAELVATSEQVAATSSRREKIAAIADLLRKLAPDEVEVAVDYLAGQLRQGRIGVGWAAVRDGRDTTAPAAEATLELGEVDRAFAQMEAAAGAGSTGERRRLLGELLGRATAVEGEFLARLVLGGLRQGALEGVMVEAVARAAGLPAPSVRRAAMLAGQLPPVAAAALRDGASGLSQFHLAVLTPVQPMLAQSAEDVAEALSQLDGAALEWKLDGARVQVHKAGDEVRVFTRSLHEVSAGVPEIVEAVRGFAARDLILDGEAIALAPGGAPLPFQQTMGRFGRTPDAGSDRSRLPLEVFFFDLLHLDGTDLLDRPARERIAALAGALPGPRIIPRIEAPSLADAEAFFEQALARGHEGVMAKSLTAPYEAGRRGSGWLKVKRASTLDLVVLAVEWGSGRRQGWLSNLHLGARDPATGGFVMLGKTFKGMTDQMLAWQTEKLLSLELGREGHVVHVRPELVVEIAFDGLQESTTYPGGLALRFARVKRYRSDKSAAEAATIAEVRAIFDRGRAP